MNLVVDVLLFVLGACLGSFSNVVIKRLPEGRSPFRGRSMCPVCGKKIPFKHNIPIVSYLVLRGRCAHCGTRISPTYIVVEVLGGAIPVLSYRFFGFTLDALRVSVLFYLLMILSFIDAEHMILPDVLTVPGVVLGVFLSSVSSPGLKVSVVGTLLGFASLYLVRFLYMRIRKIEGLGLGDVKLMAMIGAFTGPEGVIGSVFLGSLIGVLFSLFLMALKRSFNSKLKLPFGPFLALGCAVLVLFSPL